MRSVKKGKGHILSSPCKCKYAACTHTSIMEWFFQTLRKLYWPRLHYTKISKDHRYFLLKSGISDKVIYFEFTIRITIMSYKACFILVYFRNPLQKSPVWARQRYDWFLETITGNKCLISYEGKCQIPVSREIILSSRLDLSTTTGELELEISVFINREKKMWKLITTSHLQVLTGRTRLILQTVTYKMALQILHTFWCPTFRKSNFSISCNWLNFSS